MATVKGKTEVLGLGKMIDTLYTHRAKRIELQRKVDALKVSERDFKERIMNALRDQGLQGSKGSVATASITKSIEPVLEDWNKFWAYCKKEDAGHLMHHRIASKAWSEMHDAGIKVPGVGAVSVEDLSLTKASKG